MQSHSLMITHLQHICNVNISSINVLNKVIQYDHMLVVSCQMYGSPLIEKKKTLTLHAQDKYKTLCKVLNQHHWHVK